MACEFDTVDYRGVPLRCFHERWDGHILARHPYMANQQAAVITALRDPYFVFIPAGQGGNRRLYYRPLVLSPPHTNYYLLVVADYPAGRRQSGVVITAYFRQRIRVGDTLIWTKPGIRI